MGIFSDFLTHMDDPLHRARMEEVLGWVQKTFPALVPVFKWNQPMFTDHSVFIIGFSVSKHHIAVAPELAGIEHFSGEIKQAGYEHTQQLLRFPWDKPVDYSLLERMIRYNIVEKADSTGFWRK